MQRLNKNLETLNQNITDLQNNVGISEKNIKTLQTELEDVAKLEKDHEILRRQYQSFLAEGVQQTAKADAQLKKIAKFERDNANTASKGDGPNGKNLSPADAKKVAEDKTAILDWQIDSAPKIKKVTELLRELNENLSQIEDKRTQLKKDLIVWNQHHQEFTSVLKQSLAKKTELQKYTGRESY